MPIVEQRERVRMLRLLCAMAGVLVVGLLVGTFADLQITSTLYVAEQPLAQIASAIGLMPLTVPLCISLGALVQRAVAARRPVAFQVGVGCALVAVGVFCSYLMSRSFVIYDGLGPFLPFEVPKPVVIGGAVVVGALVMALGFAAATRNGEAQLTRRLVMVALLLIGSVLLVELVKNTMHRPRYRTLVRGFEGIDFHPWYKAFGGAHEMMERYGLGSDEFKSFPSGHSVQVGSTAVSFFGLAALFPALRDKWHVAFVAQIVLVVCVTFSRMVLGAHFLSDVSVGALVPILAGIFLFTRRDT